MNTTVLTICGTVLLLAVLTVITVLALHGTILGIEAIGAITTIIGIGGGAIAVHAGVNAGAKAASSDPGPPATK